MQTTRFRGSSFLLRDSFREMLTDDVIAAFYTQSPLDLSQEAKVKDYFVDIIKRFPRGCASENVKMLFDNMVLALGGEDHLQGQQVGASQ